MMIDRDFDENEELTKETELVGGALSLEEKEVERKNKGDSGEKKRRQRKKSKDREKNTEFK